MKKILAIIMTGIMCMSMSACGNNQTGESTKPTGNAADAGKKYIIYSDNSFAPFEFLDNKTKTYIGVDMDLLAAIAEDQKISYEVKNEGFDAAVGAVQAGQADAVIAGMTINDERKKTFDFSDGYFEDGQILVVPAESKITKLEDLKGKKIAAKTSTMGAKYADEQSKKIGFTVDYFEDSSTMYTAVINKTHDACFEDFSVIGWAIKNESLALKTIGEVVAPGSYGFAVKKGLNPELISKFNAGLKNIKANGKYKEILAKYGY